jgi:hypothetical protein
MWTRRYSRVGIGPLGSVCPFLQFIHLGHFLFAFDVECGRTRYNALGCKCRRLGVVGMLVDSESDFVFEVDMDIKSRHLASHAPSFGRGLATAMLVTISAATIEYFMALLFNVYSIATLGANYRYINIYRERKELEKGVVFWRIEGVHRYGADTPL